MTCNTDKAGTTTNAQGAGFAVLSKDQNHRQECLCSVKTNAQGANVKVWWRGHHNNHRQECLCSVICGQGEKKRKDDNQEWLSSVCVFNRRKRLKRNFLARGTKQMFRDAAKSAVSKVWEPILSLYGDFNEGTTTEQVT